MEAKEDLVLASGSPRRRELLERAGVAFRVEKSRGVEEWEGGLDPIGLVKHNARLKGREVSGRLADAWVLAADTTVALGDRILNKPADRENARDMLLSLAGKRHAVFTAFFLSSKSRGLEREGVVRSEVWFKSFDESVARAYTDRVEVLDKAGGYGIQEQGRLLVGGYAGSYTNIMGLPMEALWEHLRQLGFVGGELPERVRTLEPEGIQRLV